MKQVDKMVQPVSPPLDSIKLTAFRSMPSIGSENPRNHRNHEGLLLESDGSNKPISIYSHVYNWSIFTCMPFSLCSSKIDKLVQIELSLSSQQEQSLKME